MPKSIVLFDPGRVTATPAAIAALRTAGVDPVCLIDRHVTGDFGDVGQMDADSLSPSEFEENGDSLELNTLAVLNGSDRIISIYTIEERVRLWVETVSDRSYTTIYLPEEY
jgi:hypothetical protein